ncbi:MAG TPA: amidohydrolase family protein [Candidatus Nitrosotalea sp.]|nr:amidohydrolase family protein [Candidatus Nitrosotalea sp.]
MRIDVHNHAFPEAAIELVSADDAFEVRVTGRTVVGINADQQLVDTMYDSAAKLKELEEHELEAAVISVAPRLFSYQVAIEPALILCRTVNAGLREMAAFAPDRLRWMGTVPLQSPSDAVAMLDEIVAEGAVGIEIGTSVAGDPLDSAPLEPFWVAVERLALPVFIHPASLPKHPGMGAYYLGNAIGNPLETTVAAERLVAGGVLDRHPGLRIVLAHAGGFFPWQAGRLRHAASVRPELAQSPPDPYAYCGRLLFDTITHDSMALSYLISRVGKEHVLMGTDLPYDMASPQPMRTLLEATDEDTARLVAETNPARLYGF